MTSLALGGLIVHEGQRLVLGDAAWLARSLADGLVHTPVPRLAGPGAVPHHLALAHLHSIRPLFLHLRVATAYPGDCTGTWQMAETDARPCRTPLFAMGCHSHILLQLVEEGPS